MQGQEHIPSPQAKMPRNVAGSVQGGQESTVPSLLVTAGGWMDFIPCSKHTNLCPAIFLTLGLIPARTFLCSCL